MIYLVEMTAATDSVGTTTVLRATTAASWATRTSDTPSNTPYLPRVKTAGLLRRDISSPGRIGGATITGYGLVELANPDGALDGWLDYGFSGRSCVIRAGEASDAYADFTTVQSGSMDQPEATISTITVRIRDRLGELQKPLLSSKYAGTNSLPSGLEGVEDIEGSIKPRLYGTAKNFSPPCVNTSRLIFQISDEAYNSATVYDQGVALTAGSDYTSQADMETTAPSAGQVRLWKSGGYFRLGSTPAGAITCDASQGAAVANRTPAQLISAIAEDAGISTSDISSSDVTALDSAASYEAGLWISDDRTATEALDALANSVGAWYGFDRLGKLRMAQLTAPGTASFTLQPYSITQLSRAASDEGGVGLPAWRVTIDYKPVYTVQRDADLAGSVGLTTRQVVKRPVRSVIASDATIKTKHLLASDEKFSTVLNNKADAQAEATRRLALLKVERALYIVRARVNAALFSAAELGVSCAVNTTRFGLSGKTFRITGIKHDPLASVLELSIWG